MVQPIFATDVGSRLYGISTPESDRDFKGFGFETVDEILGLGHFEQQEFKNYNNGQEIAKKDTVEGVIYSVRRYVSLCMSGNPTVIEIAFSDPKFHFYTSDIGIEVCNFVKTNFLTKRLFKPYSAYHRAQLRKLQSMERTGRRKEIVDQYGFDLKFAMHAYRLARQCYIVMDEGVLRPTLDENDRKIALEFRHGVYSKEEALAILERVDKEMYEAYEKSTLPEEPDYKKTNNFLIEVYSDYLDGKFDQLFLEKEFKPF